MNRFLINGIERISPVGPEQNFDQLLAHVRQQYVNDTSLISSVKVDGVELSENDELHLHDVPLSTLESVEICFCHPREMAEDTLQTLRDFTQSLAGMSREIATRLERESCEAEFRKLIEGIQTMTEAINTVKSILRLGVFQPLNVAEADLLSILKDLLEAYEKDNRAYQVQLLRDHLPTNLEDWAKTTIPAMIQARDS